MGLYLNEEEASAFLLDRGYRVVKVDFSATDSVTSVKKLVEYFYARRLYYNKDRKFPASIDWKKDNLCASDLVRSRQKLGLSRKNAVRESAVLIDALFKYEGFLKLREPINHLTILTSRPIMDRICNYVNGEVSEVEEFKTNSYIDEINKIYDKEYAQRDFEKASEQLNKILERVNDSISGK